MMDVQIVKAWGWLVAFGAATTGLAMVGAPGTLKAGIGFLILVLAGLKAGIILRRYLGLHQSAFWRHGFEAFITVFLITAFTLYAVA
jgi:hypothetical protein